MRTVLQFFRQFIIDLFVGMKPLSERDENKQGFSGFLDLSGVK